MCEGEVLVDPGLVHAQRVDEVKSGQCDNLGVIKYSSELHGLSCPPI